MHTSVRLLCSALACLLVTATAQAQTSEDTRPAFTTSEGDTGLWYVPTAEVLAKGKWSASGYRTSFNYVPGFSNVADFPLTFGVGVAKNVELFGSFKAVTRIDRDLRPLFINDAEVGGPVARYPFMNTTWTGSKVGDFLVGAKISLLSEARQNPVALAIRGTLKLPTGDKDGGVSTGKLDGFVDVVVSKEIPRIVELSGYAGGAFRADTDTVAQSNGLRWGIGGGFPSRFPLRMTAELNGEMPFDDVITVPTAFTAVDSSRAVGDYTLHNFTAGTLGLTLQLPNGFFAGIGMTKTFPSLARTGYGSDSDPSADFVDYQFRIGFHPGVRRYVAPPPPPPPAPPAPAPAPNRAPTFGAPATAGGPPQTPIGITANVQPCATPCPVLPGQTVTLTANATDPDGDTLTYRWTAPAGTFSAPTSRTTDYTAPMQEGPVPITVTVSDGKDSVTATAGVIVQRPAPVVELTFEDVYFDFDRSSLRPEAQRLLDDAIAKLQANPTKNLIIEGHTCNIGTAEYNLALGERRAKGVADYLTARGIAASRLETRSYGEEQPKYDNAREETRRLNRRAALVIKVQ